MAALFFALLIAGWLIFNLTTPDQLRRWLRQTLALRGPLMDGFRRRRAAAEPFLTVLRTRERWPVVTPLLVLLNTALFVKMAASGDVYRGPEGLLAWGASVPTHTTAGQWWRMATTIVVHAGWLHFLVGLAALWQIGLIVERLVGRLAMAAVYVSAGLASSIVALGVAPLTPALGASGAVFGLLGVLIVCVLAGLVPLASLKVPQIPVTVLTYLAPAVVAFTLFNLITGYMPASAEFAGLGIGLSSGLLLVTQIGDRAPSWKWSAAILTAPAIVALTFMDSFQRVIDVRPSINEVLALEKQTSGAYDEAVDRFRKRRIKVGALVHTIERDILPAIEAQRTSLDTLTSVPAQHRGAVDGAKEFLRVRQESWRLRADGLRRNDARVLARADQTWPQALRVLVRESDSID